MRMTGTAEIVEPQLVEHDERMLRALLTDRRLSPENLARLAGNGLGFLELPDTVMAEIPSDAGLLDPAKGDSHPWRWGRAN